MFEYEFMRTAFFVGIMLAIAIPILGFNTTVRKLSMTGDALSHTALTGVAIGLVSGVNPVVVSIIVCVVANLLIELIRKKYSKYADVSIAIIFSFAIGLAGILSSFTSSVNFNSYLFGSILLINGLEVFLSIFICVIVVLFSSIFSKQIFYTQYNEQDAKVAGVKVGLINITLSTLTAMVVAVSSKAIGSLVVSSLLVLPVVTSMQICKGYKSTILSSIGFSLFSMISGIIISYYLGIRTGATIVMCASIVFAVVFFLVQFGNYIKKRKYFKKQ